jgi:pimeloyl-ACP methyl ester carboxylesterase
MIEKSTTGRTDFEWLEFTTRAFFTPKRRATRPLQLAGAPVAEVDFASPYGRLRAYRAGQGERVLLVHGWEGTAQQWAPLAEALVAQGCEVVVPDMPAHGGSPGTQTHVLQFARSVLAAAEAFGPFDRLAGHSMGGAAVCWAATHGLAPRRLLLVASAAEPLTFARMVAPTTGLPERLHQPWLAHIEQHVGVPFAALDVRPPLAESSAELLVFHDPKDPSVPFSHGEGIARAAPRATLQALEGVGHNRILSDPRVVAAGSAFLAGMP